LMLQIIIVITFFLQLNSFFDKDIYSNPAMYFILTCIVIFLSIANSITIINTKTKNDHKNNVFSKRYHIVSFIVTVFILILFFFSSRF
jgi:hypothetical protein